MYSDFNFGEFLVKILLLTAIVIVLQVLLRNYLNKLFHIKKKFFSYDHVNKTHQKLDWLIRMASVLIIVYFIYQDDLKETIYRSATVRKTPTSKHIVKRRCLSGSKRTLTTRFVQLTISGGRMKTPTD
ncbi:DUF4181 domain-containing protein [Oceanobacillus picturae]|uniref:DUF4181 domain-containing protein n=1 Tax=Oceanobacillus picturae TaxID=171693 RepID=UPI000E677A68|nr:DUF4181 domain-containing protein [Oceanobacillus picturae]RIU89460.1 DUF4181 domain-containing protein [Oceanobacillus picturae]